MKTLSIAGREIGFSSPPLIIAEIGNNHDGDKSQAIDLIAAAAESGAHAVKFQTYSPEKLVTPDHELYDFFNQFRLPREWHGELKDEAEKRGMLFLSTPFDVDSAEFLNELKIPAFKISSSDLTNLPLIRRCAQFEKPLLISTGMGTLKETGAAIEAAHIHGCYNVSILHCVSIYPTPVDQSQINAITELSRLFNVIVGFSDHSLSPTLPCVAVTLGARIIEKHLTLSRKLDGPDHAVALEPDEFALMVRSCEEAMASRSIPGKTLTPDLNKVRSASLRGLYAARDIMAGAVITERDIIPLRPAAELTISDLARVIGRKVARSVAKGEAISADILD